MTQEQIEQTIKSLTPEQICRVLELELPIGSEYCAAIVTGGVYQQGAAYYIHTTECPILVHDIIVNRSLRGHFSRDLAKRFEMLTKGWGKLTAVFTNGLKSFDIANIVTKDETWAIKLGGDGYATSWMSFLEKDYLFNLQHGEPTSEGKPMPVETPTTSSIIESIAQQEGFVDSAFDEAINKEMDKWQKGIENDAAYWKSRALEAEQKLRSESGIITGLPNKDLAYWKKEAERARQVNVALHEVHTRELAKAMDRALEAEAALYFDPEEGAKDAKIAQLETELDTLKATIGVSPEVTAETVKKWKLLEADNKMLRKHLEARDARIEELDKHIDSLKQDLAAAGTRIEEVNADCANYKKERWDIEKTMSRRQNELADQIYLLQQTIVMIAKS